jgi:hypothetical protein
MASTTTERTTPAPPPPPAQPRRRRLSPRRLAVVEWSLVTLGSFLLGSLLTWPLVSRMSSGMYGFGNDNLGGVWVTEWLRQVATGPEETGFTRELQYPYGMKIDERFIQPMDRFMGYALGGINDGLFGYNIQIFLSFVLSGITMYALARYVSGSRLGAAIAGVLFMAAPLHLSLSMQYNALASVQWVPLVLLAFLVALRTRRLRDAALAGAAFALLWYTSFYYGWFGAWIVGAMLIVVAIPPLWRGLRKRRLASVIGHGIRTWAPRLGLAALVFVVFVAPPLYALASDVASDPGAFGREFDDLYFSSVKPWMFFLPPHDNPVIGNLGEEFIYSHLLVLPLYEQAVYVGATVVVMTLVGVIFRRGVPERARWAMPALLTCAVVAFLFTLGPYIPLNVFSVDAWMNASAEPHVYNLPWFTFQVSAGFRYYGRAWIFGAAALAVLVAVGFVVIERRVRWLGWWAPALAAVLVATAGLAEFINRPPTRWLGLEHDPGWVQAVEKLPKDAAIVDYPVAGWSSPRSLYYIFWQTRHDRATFNPPESPRAQRVADLIRSPDDPEAGRQLKEAGIDYAVIHTKMPPRTYPPYQPRLDDDSLPPDAGQSNPWFEHHATVGDAVIYKIADRPRSFDRAALIAFGSGFGDVENEAGSNRRWMQTDDGELTLVVGGGRRRVRFVVNMLSFGEPRRLTVLIDGRPVTTRRVPAGQYVDVRVPVTLDAGRHTVRLKTDPGIRFIDDVLHNGDRREVSLRVGDPRIERADLVGTPTEPLVVDYGRGFSFFEQARNDREYRWLAARRGTLNVWSRDRPQRARVRFTVQAFIRPRILTVRHRGRVVLRREIPPDARIPLEIPLRAAQGRNELTFSTDPGPQDVGKALGNEDPRDVSVQVFAPTVTAGP